jgi:hypothetical protein
MPDHLESLRQRHARLDQKLRAELTRPLPDRAEVSRIEAEKLRPKDRRAWLARWPSATPAHGGAARPV